DSSGVFFSAFSSPQSAPHSLKVSFFACARRIIECARIIVSRYLACQELAVESSPAAISAVVKPSLCKKTTAPRSSGDLRDMRFFSKTRKKIQHLPTHRILSMVCAVVNFFFFLPRIMQGQGGS